MKNPIDITTIAGIPAQVQALIDDHSSEKDPKKLEERSEADVKAMVALAVGVIISIAIDVRRIADAQERLASAHEEEQA